LFCSEPISKIKFVEEDLRRQLKDLPNHSFYSRENFFLEEDHEDWMKQSKDHINSLLKQLNPKKKGFSHSISTSKEKDLSILKVEKHKSFSKIQFNNFFFFFFSLRPQ